MHLYQKIVNNQYIVHIYLQGYGGDYIQITQQYRCCKALRASKRNCYTKSSYIFLLLLVLLKCLHILSELGYDLLYYNTRNIHVLVNVLLGFLTSRNNYGNLASISFPDILVGQNGALYDTLFCLAIDASILGYSFRSLANSVFGEYPWQNEMNRRLYFLSWCWYIACCSFLIQTPLRVSLQIRRARNCLLWTKPYLKCQCMDAAASKRCCKGIYHTIPFAFSSCAPSSLFRGIKLY